MIMDFKMVRGHDAEKLLMIRPAFKNFVKSIFQAKIHF